MEDQVFEQETGVESASAAEEQQVEYESNDQSDTSSYEETGVEPSDAAGQIKDEKDFSSALKAREAQLRKQIEQEYTPYKQQASAIEKLSQMSGYTNTQEFLQAVEQAEQQRRIQEEAQRMGVDESTYQQYFQPVNERLQNYERELETLRTERAQREIENTVQQLRSKYDDFDTYADQAFNMVLSGEVRDLERAYRLSSMDDKFNNLSKQKEQEVLARVSGRDGRQVLPSTDKPGQVKVDPSSMSFEEIQELSRRARSGERITF
jgi:hypothetical protein